TPVADAVVACHGFCGVLLLSTTLPIYHCPPQLPIDPFMQQSPWNIKIALGCSKVVKITVMKASN
ncbi:MAG: hypothetical protein WA885_21340, partial [Phormidesmis sp.]